MAYKTIQIPLTMEEYDLVSRACASFISKTGTPVSVTRYAKNLLMEDAKRTQENNGAMKA